MCAAWGNGRALAVPPHAKNAELAQEGEPKRQQGLSPCLPPSSWCAGCGAKVQRQAAMMGLQQRVVADSQTLHYRWERGPSMHLLPRQGPNLDPEKKTHHETSALG